MLYDFRRPNVKMCILPGLVDLVGFSWKSRNTEYDCTWRNGWCFVYDWHIIDKGTCWHARRWRRWVSLHAMPLSQESISIHSQLSFLAA
jgi:hypothetical protein